MKILPRGLLSRDIEKFRQQSKFWFFGFRRRMAGNIPKHALPKYFCEKTKNEYFSTQGTFQGLRKFPVKIRIFGFWIFDLDWSEIWCLSLSLSLSLSISERGTCIKSWLSKCISRYMSIGLSKTAIKHFVKCM